MIRRIPLHRLMKTPGILLDWLAAICHKSLILSIFLFEWKTSK